MWTPALGRLKEEIVFKENDDNTFFKKNKKYRIIESFETELLNNQHSFFEKNEQVIFKGYNFVPYDEIYIFNFINKLKEYKWIIVDGKNRLSAYNELSMYYKYFVEEEKEKKISLWAKIKRLLK